MDLIWGLKAAATDSWLGALDGVVLNSESRRVTHLIIKRGLLFARRHQISATHISRCDHEGVYLDIPIADVFPAAPEQTPDDDSVTASLNSKTAVNASDASLRLKGLRVNRETFLVTHLILHERGERDFVAPVDYVTELRSEQITLGIAQPEIENLPVYRLDHDIEADIWEALYGSEEISDIDLKTITLHVNDGNVTMEGNMRDPSAVTEAEVVAALVPGVAAVENRIVSDWHIDLEIARLVAKKAPELAANVNIHSQLGVVTLSGHLSSEEEKSGVLEAIPSIAGVRSVHDNVEIRVAVPIAIEAAEEARDEGQGDQSAAEQPEDVDKEDGESQTS